MADHALHGQKSSNLLPLQHKTISIRFITFPFLHQFFLPPSALEITSTDFN